MKRKITLLVFAAGVLFSGHAQVILSEDFTQPFDTATNNWIIINNSSPVGSDSWTQGNQTTGNGTLTAYNGATNDFYMADFTSIAANQSGGISAFLITPTVTIYNGAELRFATRTLSQTATVFPDRLQVLMSQTANTTIATTTTSVGSFTNILLDINPNQTTGTSSVVSGGTVNGYPQLWTVYTLPISGVTGTVTGRFAFRYFVTNGGEIGTNSRLVALDAVRFTLPCIPTVNSYTTCPGMSTTLTALNVASSTTFSWNTGATSSSIVVNPGSTTVYSVFPILGGSVTCGNIETVTVTIGSQLSVLVGTSETTVCAGSPVVLSSTTSAENFLWTDGTSTVGTVATITLNPTVSATYSLTAASFNTLSSTFCAGGNSIAIIVNPNPTITAGTANTIICTSGASTTVNFTATGASVYRWYDDDSAFTGTSTTQAFAAPIPAISAATNLSVFVLGVDGNGCLDTLTVPYTAVLNPVITGTVSNNPACSNSTVSLDVEGADTYTWTGPVTGTSSSISFTTGTVTGSRDFTVTGANADGCKNSKVLTVIVNDCLGIEQAEGDNSASSVFPNPFTNQLSISGLSGRVTICNALGQLVVTKDMTGSNETFDMAGLPKGVYILIAQDKNGVNTKTIKLVKN